MLPDAHRHIPVEIKLPMRKAKGGLASAAQHVADAGEGGDTMLVHVNKAEFETLRKQWGEPTVNPKTGMPSYSWGDWLGPIAGVLGGVTGIGGSIGDAIGGATGLYDAGGTLSNAVGSGLLGAGVGALGGGARGALYGGLAGGATPYLSNLITGGTGNGSVSSLAGLFGGGGASGALQGPTTSGATLDSANAASDYNSTQALGDGAKSGGGGLGSLFGGKGGAMPYLLAGLVAANALGGKKGPSDAEKAAAAREGTQQANFNKPLQPVNFNRTLMPLMGDPRRYGFGPTQNRFMNNQLGQNGSVAPTGYASGGRVPSRHGGYYQNFQTNSEQGMRGMTRQESVDTARDADNDQAYIDRLADEHQRSLGYARGGLSAVAGPGTGRSDDIPARLSDGEYVLDAESVSLLGDGSAKAGAAKLDQMRENIRRQKGGALSQGRISPNAKMPEQYMAGGLK